MEFSTAADLISALAVTIGLVFAAVQVREYRRAQEREAALELLRSFQTTDFAHALLLLFEMPDNLSKREVEACMGDRMPILYSLMTTWESLGILIFRGEVNLDMVDDFFSGPIVISWRKLRRYVEDQRQEQQRDTIEEWFQWLAERMGERESATPPLPAHVAHRHWRPQ